MAERVVAIAAVEEVVTVEQQSGEEQRAVQRPVDAFRAERVRGLPPLVEVLQPVDQAAEYVLKVGGDARALRQQILAGGRSRTEQVAPHPHSEESRGHVTGAREPHGRGRASQAAAGYQVDAQAYPAADEPEDGARGRRDR